ncbi:MAG: sulfite exporter TauE/SafE family protein [Myxococcales bacterium]|nr:sulfite exporter TauE/SafE family protein [Myxococcales bacterium]
MDISFAWLFCVVFLAHFTESVLGFGCGLLILALASYPLNILLPVLIPLNIVLSLSILARDRRAVSPILWRQMLPWAGLGLPLGFTLFRVLPERNTRMLFGAILLFLTLWGLWRSRQAKANASSSDTSSSTSTAHTTAPTTAPTTAHTTAPTMHIPAWQGRFFLFGGGLLQGLYATGGPFIVYFVSRQALEKRSFRATLSALWFMLNSTIFFGILLRGEYTAQHGYFFLGTLPAVLLGIHFGEKFHHRVDEKIFSGLVQGLLLFAGMRFLLSS